MAGAKKWNIAHDFNRIGAIGFCPVSRATPPPNPVVGEMYVDSINDTPMIYADGGWRKVGIEDFYLSGLSDVAIGSPAQYQVLSYTGTMWSNSSINAQMLPIANDGVSNSGLIVRSNDSRLANSRTPTGTAGGDLAGNYPSPTVGTRKVGLAKIAADAIQAGIDAGGVGVAGTAAAGTPALRALGTGANDAMPGNAKLNQLQPPTAAVQMNGQKLSDLGTPVDMADAATKAYVDQLANNVRQGVDAKESVRVATTTSVGTYNATGGIALRGILTAAPSVLDGVNLAVEDRILVKNHSNPAANGIYFVSTVGTGATGVWQRAGDFDQDPEVTAGAFVFVAEGATQADTGWILTTNDPITIGGSSGTGLTWVQFSSAGVVTAGNGLTKSGNELNVNPDNSTLEVTPSQVRIKDLGVTTAKVANGAVTLTPGATQKVAGTLPVANGGTGGTTPATARGNIGAPGQSTTVQAGFTANIEVVVTHGVGDWPLVQIWNTATGRQEEFDVRRVSSSQIGVTSEVTLTDSYRIVCVG